MVKNILTALMLISVAYAQEPAYTPMRLNYQFRGIKVDSLFLVPSFSDTTSANSSTMKNVAGAMIRTGNDFWMRNAATTAWLQNVNVGNGSSIGTLNSPDRINGSATGAVTADMQTFILRFTNADQWKIDNTDYINLESDSIVSLSAKKIVHQTGGNKYELKDFNNTFLRIDTLGNFEAGDLTKDSLVFKLSVSDSNFYILSKAPSIWREKNSGLTSQVKTGYPKNDIDLSSGDYEIKLPGVYSVMDASTNNLILPDPANWGGQSITIINKDTNTDITFAGGYDPYIYDGSQISTQWQSSILTIYSDSSNWFGIYNK